MINYRIKSIKRTKQRQSTLSSTSVVKLSRNRSGHLLEQDPLQRIDCGDQACGRCPARDFAPFRANQPGYGRQRDQDGAGKAMNETPPSNEQINMDEGSAGPISVKWGAGWGLAGQEFEGGGGRVLAAPHVPLHRFQRWIERWVLPAPFF